MSPRLRAALYAQAGAVFSLHPCLHAGDRPTAGRSRFATILPGDAAVSPSNGDHAGTQWADPPPPRNGPKHRGAGRSRSATGPPPQSRSTRQFFCAEVLAAAGIRISMDGRGRWIDNVFIERLWRSLKYEDIYLKGYADGPEAKAGIAEWLAFYNHRRPHQALANRTPMAVWRARGGGAPGGEAVDMTLRLDNPGGLPTSPQPQQSQVLVA